MSKQIRVTFATFLLLLAPLASGAGFDIKQVDYWITETLRQLGVKGDLDREIRRKVHDNLEPLKVRGGTVGRAQVEELVLEHDSAIKRNNYGKGNRKANHGRRISKRLLGGLGIGIGVVMLADEAAAGTLEWTDVAGNVPVVGPVITTFVIADEYISGQVAQVEDAFRALEQARQANVTGNWKLAITMANRVAKDAKYPWSGDGWKDIEYIRGDEVYAIFEEMITRIQSRLTACDTMTIGQLNKVIEEEKARFEKALRERAVQERKRDIIVM